MVVGMIGQYQTSDAKFQACSEAWLFETLFFQQHPKMFIESVGTGCLADIKSGNKCWNRPLAHTWAAAISAVLYTFSCQAKTWVTLNLSGTVEQHSTRTDMYSGSESSRYRHCCCHAIMVRHHCNSSIAGQHRVLWSIKYPEQSLHPVGNSCKGPCSGRKGRSEI